MVLVQCLTICLTPNHENFVFLLIKKKFIVVSLIYNLMTMVNTQLSDLFFTYIINSLAPRVQSLSIIAVRCYRVINGILNAVLLSP